MYGYAVARTAAQRILADWTETHPEHANCTCDLCVFDNDSKTDWSSDDGHEPV